MADAPRTSFIPKQNAAQQKMPAPKRKRTFNIFNFLVFVVFLAAVIAAGAVFLMKTRADAQLSQAQSELAGIRETFSTADIHSLRELDQRIKVAKSILDKHLSPTRVFDMLERRTQGLAQFTSFLYRRNESGNVALLLNGVAPSFNTVALQSQEFVSESMLERAFFTNMDIVVTGTEGTETERVRFRVTSSVDTDLIPYESRSTLAPSNEPEETSSEESGTTTEEAPDAQDPEETDPDANQDVTS